MLNPYQPNYYSFYPQQNQILQPTQMPQQQISQQQQEIQNGFINVPSEAVARNYPVAPGNSLVFKDENLPFIYTKTMGFSQLDRPEFEKFRLVKDETEEIVAVADTNDIEKKIDEMDARFKTVDNKIEALEREIVNLKKHNGNKNRKDDDR